MKTLTVEYLSPACAEFNGWPNVRDLHTELTGRPPAWNARSRRWVTQPHCATDLVALAGMRGYRVTEVGKPAPKVLPSLSPPSSSIRKTFEPDGLW